MDKLPHSFENLYIGDDGKFHQGIIYYEYGIAKYREEKIYEIKDGVLEEVLDTNKTINETK